MNVKLIKEVSVEEIKKAAFQLGSLKAPRPNGYPGELNRTNIVSIPKVLFPVSLGQYRPISRCNFSVKVITKVMANRLKSHLQKAYDRVEWDFLEALLLKMGFHSRRVQWVMQCISTVNFFVVLERLTVFQVSSFIETALSCPISSLLMMLCCSLKAGFQSCDRIKKILEIYGIASGQRINFDNSSVTFSSNMCDNDNQLVCDLLDVPLMKSDAKYLGLPFLQGKSKTEAYSFIMEKTVGKL
ncbi:uncharacterized protein LOC131321268 [Rhododendron vialii]|uniref:uncharacterized protein LOC131321268 n=1 Tax=Rhododendron vialii TaxID=182163 RepID=UPI00265E4712|nr:uncharacterized protein LOC131321268 [Rhododendron vialii]